MTKSRPKTTRYDHVYLTNMGIEQNDEPGTECSTHNQIHGEKCDVQRNGMFNARWDARCVTGCSPLDGKLSAQQADGYLACNEMRGTRLEVCR
jgi:hypothetical protein